MKRLLLISFVALAVPVTSFAKGASEATIDGPGLDGAVEVSQGSTLSRLAELSGIYPSVFETTPNPMLETQPGIDLGPRYVVRWVMPFPEGSSEVVQDLYPYARPFPVSYTEPGQTFFGGMRTVGGWYQGTPELKQELDSIGLPTRPPTAGDGGMDGWQIGLVAIGGATVAALAAGFGWRRRAPASA